MSLRKRVLLGFLMVAVALVVTNVVLASAFERNLLRSVDEKLESTSRMPLFTPPSFGGSGEDRGGPSAPEPLSDLYIGRAEVDGTGMERLGRGIDEEQSPPAPTPSELVERAGDRSSVRPFTVDSVDGSGTWRVVVLTGPNEDELIVLATDLGQVRSTLNQMWMIQLVGSAGVLASLGAVLWWVLRLGVRPLVVMAAAADEIAAGDLSHRVGPTDERTEAGRLGVAFNSMLTVIEEAFGERDATEARLRRFAADASHELRTPLTSIRGYADLWQAGGLRDPGQIDQAMRRLSDEGRRMGALVDDLLLLARLDQQRPLERRPVRLDQLAGDSVDDSRVIDPTRPITLDGSPATVEGDELRLQQVVANLITNARVHTPPGTSIQVVVSAEGGMARLEVSDDGPGMTPEMVTQLFERFYRGDRARGRSTGGSGLGLSIVDAIVRAHGGRTSVESTPGVGSRFVVELPGGHRAS